MKIISLFIATTSLIMALGWAAIGITQIEKARQLAIDTDQTITYQLEVAGYEGDTE